MTSVFLQNPKTPFNVAAAVRAASCYDVAEVIWTGTRVSQAMDDMATGKRKFRLPREERLRGYKDVRLWNATEAGMLAHLEEIRGSVPIVCVELLPGSQPLTTFVHPERSGTVYLFGPEDGSVSKAWRSCAGSFVFIPTNHCVNLAAAIYTTLYDRRAKRQLAGLEPILPVDQQLRVSGEREEPVDTLSVLMRQ